MAGHPLTEQGWTDSLSRGKVSGAPSQGRPSSSWPSTSVAQTATHTGRHGAAKSRAPQPETAETEVALASGGSSHAAGPTAPGVEPNTVSFQLLNGFHSQSGWL